MPLSISKLQELLLSKGFVPNKYFIMDGLCFFIEIFCLKTADLFLMYIPSKYNFVIHSGDNVFKIRYIAMNVADNKTDEYGQDINLQDAYGDVNIELSPDKEKIEDDLEDNYKRPISLDEISTEDTDVLKSIYRQMRRLRYCVQNIKYKLAVVYKNYICAIRRDESIDCFSIKHYSRQECKKLYIVIDLETFYDKSEKLLEDLHTVREGVYRVLEKNQGMHSRVINKMIENRKDIAIIPQQAEMKKERYDTALFKLQKMMAIMITADQRIHEQLARINRDANGGLQNDITQVHQRSKLQKELDQINFIKSDIAKQLLLVREKRENSILSIDKIMFDNTVMFNTMLNNFGKLKEFC